LEGTLEVGFTSCLTFMRRFRFDLGGVVAAVEVFADLSDFFGRSFPQLVAD